MKKNNLSILLLVSIITFFSSISQAEVIRGLHILSTGNNQYEAKIKAHIEGMTQALHLTADKIGIKNATFDNIPYSELKSVFAIDSIISEKSYDEKYTADVNYSYTNIGVQELILKHGNEAVRKQFFNYIVIPVFKQKNIISFLDSKTDWLETWIDSAEECTKHRLLPIDPTKNSSTISTSNIFSMSYLDFLNDLKIKRFKNVLIAICEYFTRDDGSMYFKVTTHDLSHLGKNITETTYNITNPDNARDYFDIAIQRVISKYGDPENYDMHYKNGNDVAYESEKIISQNSTKKAGSVLDALLVQPKVGKKLTKLDMRLDIFSAEELDSIKTKLKAVKEVVKFQIDIGDDKQYKIALYINDSMQSLAEGFYSHGISYKLYDGQYVMFELVSGI